MPLKRCDMSVAALAGVSPVMLRVALLSEMPLLGNRTPACGSRFLRIDAEAALHFATCVISLEARMYHSNIERTGEHGLRFTSSLSLVVTTLRTAQRGECERAEGAASIQPQTVSCVA